MKRSTHERIAQEDASLAEERRKRRELRESSRTRRPASAEERDTRRVLSEIRRRIGDTPVSDDDKRLIKELAREIPIYQVAEKFERDTIMCVAIAEGLV